MTLEAMPCNESSPVYPFSGYVLNVNIITRAHKDANDKEICLVIVIVDDDKVGGELYLVEPGLVLALRNGDVVIFDSTKVSHFNQHFIGQWGSFIFQTDRHMDGWAGSRNGWKHNIHIRTTWSNEKNSGL